MVLSDIVYRISLDDNHNNVALTCAKAILSALSCDMNNILFDIWEVEFHFSKGVFIVLVFDYEFICVTCTHSFFRRHQLIQGMYLLLLYSEVNQMLMLVFFVVGFGSIIPNLPIFFVLVRNWWMTALKVGTLFRMM